MRIGRVLAVCSGLIAALPALAVAQEQRKVGITMGYPASLGVLWHVNKKVAIRPEISFATSSNETTSSVQTIPTVTIETDSWVIGTGASALFYLREYDHLRTYVAPRITYSHTSTDGSSSGLTTIVSTQTTNTWSGAGLFGAQYMLGDRFSLFGEVGFGFSHSDSKISLSTSSSSGTSWGTRAGVGVVFYF